MSKPYPPAILCQAIAPLEEACTLRDAAPTLGIIESCPHRWRHWLRVDQPPESGVSCSGRTEWAGSRIVDCLSGVDSFG